MRVESFWRRVLCSTLALQLLVACASAREGDASPDLSRESHPSVGTPQSPPAATSTVNRTHEKVAREWYQIGIWPLTGSVLAIVFSSLVTVFVVYFQSKRTLAVAFEQKRLDRINNALTEFYDPLVSLMTANAQIFLQTGPQSFPSEHAEREAAATVWNEAKKKVLQNNERIEQIILTKSHLIHKADTLERYTPLLIHVSMYQVFQVVQSDIYSKYRFPEDISQHVKDMRSLMLKDRKILLGGRE